MAEYAQMQQIEGGQRQAEIADMQLEELRRDRDTLNQIQAAIVAKGGPADLGAAADAMIKSPKYLEQGLRIKETLRKQELLNQYESQYGGGAPAMPSSAPGAMAAPSAPAPRVERGVDAYGKPFEAEVGGGIAPPGAMGQPLAPFGAAPLAPAAPTAPINAIAPVSAMPDVNALRRQYSMAVAAGSPDAPVILKQVESALRGEQNRPMAVSPGQVVIDPRTGQQIFNAPGKTTLSDRFVPVGRLVFDRETQQYISPSQAQLAQSQERPATAARVAENAAPRKPMTELQQQAFRKGMAADKTGVKASQSVVNELEKLTDELVGNPEKKIAPHPGLSGITGIQAMLPSLPESLVTSGNARKAQQRLETLKGKVMAFGRQLASLEGKLGNMAVQEWKFVSDSIQAIDPAAGNLDVQLRDIVRQAKNFANTVQERYDLTYETDGAPAEPTAAPTPAAPTPAAPTPAAPALAAPKVGTIQQGYRFKGGNPADQKNWEKQ